MDVFTTDLLTICYEHDIKTNHHETTPVGDNQPSETMHVEGEEEEEDEEDEEDQEEDEEDEEDQEEEEENDQISGNGKYVDLNLYMIQSPNYQFGIHPDDKANLKLYDAVNDAFKNPHIVTEESTRAKDHFNNCQIEKCFVCIRSRALFVDIFENSARYIFLYSKGLNDVNAARENLIKFKEYLDTKYKDLNEYYTPEETSEAESKRAVLETFANNFNVIITMIYHKFNERRKTIFRQNSIFDLSRIEILPTQDEQQTMECDICAEQCNRFVKIICPHHMCIVCYSKMRTISYYQCPFCKSIGEFASLL